MKNKLLVLCASSLLSGAALGQVLIGGSTENGDFEGADLAPFVPGDHASVSADFNNTDGGSQSMKIDLTANNGAGQWKGIAGNLEYPISNANIPITVGAWVYVPSSTTFGPTANILMGVEESNDDFATQLQGWGDQVRPSANLNNAPRDEWFQVVSEFASLNSETTQIRTRAWNLTTVNEVNGVPAFGTADPEADPPVLAATPEDWNAAGYSGSIYIDDISIVQGARPPAPRNEIVIGPGVNNGDFESSGLTPFGPGAISTAQNNTAGGSQSLEIDLQSVTGSGEWKGYVDVSVDVREQNETHSVSAWVFMPSTTVAGNEGNPASVAVALRGLRPGGSGFQFLGGATANLKTMATDEWVLFQSADLKLDDLNNGEGDFTTVSTAASFLTRIRDVNGGDNNGTTASPSDWAAEGYSGSYFIDDYTWEINRFVLPPRQEVIVGGDINNGDMEAADIAPFTGGVISTAQNNTDGGSQSLEIDLQSPTGNGQWRGLSGEPISINVAQQDETYNMSAWFYLPSTASAGNEGNPATISWGLRGLRPGTEASFQFLGGMTADLKTMATDEWVQFMANDIALAGNADATGDFTAVNTGESFLARIRDVNGGTDNGSTAAPSDWAAEGYSGSVFVDDLFWEVIRPAIPIAPLNVTSVVYNDDGTVTIEFTSTVDIVDVYVNRNPDADPSAFVLELDGEEISSPWTDTAASGGKTLYQLREFVE